MIDVIGSNDGGGGNANPAKGGVDVCNREGGREDVRAPDDMIAVGFDSPEPDAPAGVAERDGTKGGASGGITV